MNALRIYKVELTPVPSEPEAVPLRDDDAGLRTKLGGQPYWIQNAETPACVHCGKEMTFVGQLDSIEHQSDANPNSRDALGDDQQYMFGDVGLIYVFFCFDCSEPKAVFQCY